MPQVKITGGNKLKGNVNISGAKNAILPLMAAAVLCDGESVFYNCPDLSDVRTSIDILRHLGIDASFNSGVVHIEGRIPVNSEIPEYMMRKMRSSVVFAGAVLARKGKAAVSMPGGCELGPRPIDLHILSLKKLGADLKEEYGSLKFSAPSGLKGNVINFGFQSVGATENAILAAVLADGVTEINNAAREPEIGNLIDFLVKAGADIKGKGTSTLIINGVKSLKGVSHTVIPDRIEAATFMSAAAVTGGEITLYNIEPEHLENINGVFRLMGCKIDTDNTRLKITAPKVLSPVPLIKSFIYPLFPTDAGPLTVAALCKANGVSVFSEGIFKNRFSYIEELKRMGADINTEGNIAMINGGKPIRGAHVLCTDLRGGAALCIAALGADGTTVIGNTDYIKRGYERFWDKLSCIGAEIKTEEF